MDQISVWTNRQGFSPSVLEDLNSQLQEKKQVVWCDLLKQPNFIVDPHLIETHCSNEGLIAQAVEDAVDSERKRLARDLHDAVSQTLFAASMIAEVLPDLWDIDEAKARKSSEDLRQLTRGALAEMRSLLLELRPAALYQANLPDLLKQISDAIIGRERLPIHLTMTGMCEIPCEVKVEIYRIAQESLNNIVKYARATCVDVTLQLSTESIHLEIRDDGAGFDPACVKPTSMGLRIMRERADSIGACLQVSSQTGHGTTVSLDWHR